MKVSESFKETFNSALEDCFVDLLEAQEPFAVLISAEGWAEPLSERLIQAGKFFIQIQEQALIDSYFDGKDIVVVTEFDGVQNSKVVTADDISGIFTVDMKTPIMLKPFEMTKVEKTKKEFKKLHGDPMKYFTEDELTPEVLRSLEWIVKNNKEMFNEH